MYFNLLKECNNVALVLPEYLCYNFSKRLKEDNRIQPHVFIGKDESHSSISWRFILSGIIQPSLTQRIKGAYESGLWLRATLLDDGTKSFTNDQINVAAASMGGNIVVVFFVLLAGLAISVTCIFLECGGYICHHCVK